MSIATRFHLLCLCAAELALPSIAVAQPPQLVVERVWTQDAAGNTKSVFAPGDTIKIVGRLNNPNDGAPFSAALAVTTPFYNDTQRVDISPGRNTWIWNTYAPPNEDNYTITVRAFNSSYRVWAISSAQFAVHSPPQLSTGWYKSNTENEKPLIYEDNAGLRIVLGNSYVYPHSNNKRYWYVELKYLNMSKHDLLISCIGHNEPSHIREHMRGANSGSFAADETFCSRNPNFTGSIMPGGNHLRMGHIS